MAEQRNEVAMEFAEKLHTLRNKVRAQQGAIETEEATKTAFVMPFISTILGYDVFNPLEVVPEFTADVGVKKGEKIDYAIVEGDVVRMLIECKKSRSELNVEHASQLFRYFATTDARIAVLTNGVVYQFFTDLDKPNRMDESPFLELDFNDLDETVVPELVKLTKEAFDLDSVLGAAEELKYVGQIKRLIAAQFQEPEEDWLRFFVSRVYSGQFTQHAREQFTPLVMTATKQFLNDRVNSRLKSALGSDDYEPASPESATTDATNGGDQGDVPDAHATEVHDKGIETTFEELEGYRIVMAIVCSEVEPERVAKRDTKSYFGVLLDDNNRKPITRLHFNTHQKYLGLFDRDKNETRFPIEHLTDIYQHSDSLRETVHHYD